MAAGRKSLISRRRRDAEEGEDEEGLVMEDSQSEGSMLSEADEEEEDGDASSVDNAADAEPTAATHTTSDASPAESKGKKPRKPRKRTSRKGREAGAESLQPQSEFTVTADTEAMMNGLGISEDVPAEQVLDFESMEPAAATPTKPVTANGHSMTPADRQRREHEEYKRKRDSDPAFIPNRGNFFMHDTRGQPNGQPPPLRGVWQNRNRGRGGASVGGPFSPANQLASAERAAEQQWKHDLHDTINEELPPHTTAARSFIATQEGQTGSANVFSGQQSLPSNADQPRVLSFSKTTLVGMVQIRVSLLGMKTPTTFSDIPWKHYTRLPDHRPPLRRDKPVRIRLPGWGDREARFIFPAHERAFTFIPRQQRPNQQGFHRGQHQRSIGGYGYSSRRTSMYGGSIYSGSVAPSRRSSLAGINRENAFSPAGSFVVAPSARPIVRLPHGNQPFSGMSTPIGPLSGHQTPTGLPQIHMFPPPQQPELYGTPASSVHQPQARKPLSVTGIESPMLQQEPQPFRNQLPAHMNEPPPPYFSPQHNFPQPHAGTPLSGIPEQAVHAPAFQPPVFAPPQYYAAYPPPQNFYFPQGPPTGPPHTGNSYPQMPMYMLPPHPQGYLVPPPPPQQPHITPHQQQPPPPPPPEQPSETPQISSQQSQQQQSQSGMVAHESNGMVFYVPASEAQSSERYQPAESFVPSYAMPGLPPPTPAPESSMGYYYPAPPHPHQGMPGSAGVGIGQGMQEVGAAVYYPTRGQ